MGSKGIVASTAALSVLLQEGIGDTIRISLTPEPGASRTQEVVVAQELLQTMGLRAFTPLVTACPGCGRTTSEFFQELAKTRAGARARADAGMEDQSSRRRGPDPRGDGLHRQRPRRIASTPTSASRCPAPAKHRRRRCSSTARRGDAARRAHRRGVRRHDRGATSRTNTPCVEAGSRFRGYGQRHQEHGQMQPGPTPETAGRAAARNSWR